MARKTAGTAAAPSPADKEKAGATKPAKAAAKPVEASKPAPESVVPAAPASTEEKGTAGVTVEADLFVFSVPVVTEFPVVLTLTNAWPGRHDVAGTNESLAPGETREVEFTEKGYARFTKQTTQLADLHGWTEEQGILIEQGEKDAED